MPRRRRRKRRQRDDDDERIPLLSLSKKRKGNGHARSLLSSFSPFLRRKRIKKRFVDAKEHFCYGIACTCVTKYPPLSSLFLSLSLLFWRRLRPQARLSFFDQKTIHSSRGIKIKLFQIHSAAVASNWCNARTRQQQQKNRRERSLPVVSRDLLLRTQHARFTFYTHA